MKSVHSKFLCVALTCLFVFSLPVSVSAEDGKKDKVIHCALGSNYKPKPTSPRWEGLQQEAIKIGDELCRNILGPEGAEHQDFNARFYRLAGEFSVEVNSAFPESDFSGMEHLTDTWVNQLKDYELDLNNLAIIEFKDDPGAPGQDDRLRVSLPPTYDLAHTYSIDSAQNDKCKQDIGATSCGQVGMFLEAAIDPILVNLKNVRLKENGSKLTKLQSEWDRFVKESRYQTPLDVMFTTYMYRNKYKGLTLEGPPDMQYFLLHPTLVFEHVDDLEKGNKDDVSLAVEWIGVNFWKKGIGISATSVYKDREEIDSVGHGFTIHYENKYSFGYIFRSGGYDSFFFNVDLLEWFGDKKEKYEKYKERF